MTNAIMASTEGEVNVKIFMKYSFDMKDMSMCWSFSLIVSEGKYNFCSYSNTHRQSFCFSNNLYFSNP